MQIQIQSVYTIWHIHGCNFMNKKQWWQNSAEVLQGSHFDTLRFGWQSNAWSQRALQIQEAEIWATKHHINKPNQEGKGIVHANMEMIIVVSFYHDCQMAAQETTLALQLFKLNFKSTFQNLNSFQNLEIQNRYKNGYFISKIRPVDNIGPWLIIPRRQQTSALSKLGRNSIVAESPLCQRRTPISRPHTSRHLSSFSILLSFDSRRNRSEIGF